MNVRLIAFGSLIAAVAGGSLIVAEHRPAAAAHPSRIASAVSVPAVGQDDFVIQKAARRSFPPGIAIVYSSTELHLYNTTTHETRQLTRDGATKVFVRFRGHDIVSYVVDNQVYSLAISTGKKTKLATVPSSIAAYDMSPDGSKLAIVYDVTNVSTSEALRYVRLVNLKSRSYSTIPFGASIPTDTCGADDHETHVTFSFDGSRMLVEDTTFDAKGKTLYVFDTLGHQLVQPMHAVWARWIPGTLSFIARGYTSMSWFRTDTTTAISDVYPLPDEARRPMFSPDGAQIAFDNGSSSPKLSVYNVATKHYHLITTGYVAAVWTAPDQLLASVADACNGCPIPWSPGNGAALVGTDGSVTRMPFASSLTSDVEFHE